MESSNASLLNFASRAPEVQPLTTVEALLSWRPSIDECRFCAAIQPLPLLIDGGLKADRPRLLACHDLRGGYLEDRLIQGGSDARASYRFCHWHCIDAFVYFSHKLVTIPPPGWTNAAHIHGVPVLGTFLTEWDDGAAACAQLLASDASAQHAAHQLALIAEHLCFDGWIINIENDLPTELMPRLVLFCKCLTAAMHAAMPGRSTVIWYDSVTIEGRLEWQNAVTPLNRPFFDACDGIWINYTWLESTPRLTALEAGQRRRDVYMGVDVFGRGTYGGGGKNCDVALTAALKEGLSVALFAIAWPFEMCELRDTAEDIHTPQNNNNNNNNSGKELELEKEDYRDRWILQDAQFWGLIKRAWGVRRATVCALPFFSDFSNGAGPALTCAGRTVFPEPWYTMSLQSPQPELVFKGHKPQELAGSFPSDVSYSGGTCLRFFGELSSPVCVRLFRGAAPVPAGGLRARFTIAVSGSGTSLRLGLRFRKRISGVPDPVTQDLSPRRGEVGECEWGVELGPVDPRQASKTTPFFPQSVFKPASRAIEVAFLSISTSTMRENRQQPVNSEGGGGHGDHLQQPPHAWTTFDFALQPTDLPKWIARGHGVLTAIEIVADSTVVGATCPCNAFIGAIAVGGMQHGCLPQCASVKGLHVEGITVARSSEIPHPHGIERGVVEPINNRRGVLLLSATLAWKMPLGVWQCHVYMRVGVKCPMEGNGGLKKELEGQKQQPRRRVEWSAPRMIGMACCPAFRVSSAVLPEGTVGVRLIVASTAVGGMQPLREAATATVRIDHEESDVD